MLKKLKRMFADESAAVMVLVALGLVVIMGAAAMVVDVGLLYSERAKASNAIDAAVMAGIRELPDDPSSALAVAQNYAQMNGFDLAEVTFTLGYNDEGEAISLSGDVDTDMGMVFAPVLGINTGDVKAHAKARVGPVGGFTNGNGVIPIGIRQSELPNFEEETNPSLIIKEGGGDGDNGWFGYVNIDGQQIKWDIAPGIMYGCQNPVYIGQTLNVVPGNKNAKDCRDAIDYRLLGCTHDPECSADSYDLGCPRVVFVPVGVDDEGHGANQEYTITGFAAVLLEERTEEDKQQAIRGTYLQPIIAPNGYIDDNAPDYGVYAVELCE